MGGKSIRQNWNSVFEKNQLHYISKTRVDGTIQDPSYQFVEVNLGNICNLKCRMCHPNWSSSWVKESQDHGWIDEAQVQSLKNMNWFKGTDYLTTLKRSFKQAQIINFVGGEPLAHPDHTKILQIATEHGNAEEVSLNYTTNLTKVPNEIIASWRKFAGVKINVSCDGIKNVYEYIRYPAKWSAFEGNLDLISELSEEINLSFTINTTLQVLNATRLSELIDWMSKRKPSRGASRIPYVNYVSDPAWLDPVILPISLKKQAEDEIKNSLNRQTELSPKEKQLAQLALTQVDRMMHSHEGQDYSLARDKFRINNKKMDNYRNQRLNLELPEISAAMG